ncbi:lectin-like isoform X2 [Narcine bancroftii]|uniref:lectin-like isoform X2 n=1 Tax=Narcine bancroftii TaxID=1343680 RepID=UPI00383131FD
MLESVLVLTVLLACDMAGEEIQLDLEKREIVNGPCDENWFHFPPLNSCYRFFCDSRTWWDAEEFCNHRSNYGHLASVNSEDHQEFILDIIYAVNRNMPITWIGLNDRCKEGTFNWIDGSSLDYQNWAKGEPNNLRNEEHCVNMNYFRDGTWNDEVCDKKFAFVCSYKVRCS